MKTQYQIRDTLTHAERQRIRRWIRRVEENGAYDVELDRNILTIYTDDDAPDGYSDSIYPEQIVRYAMMVAGRTFNADKIHQEESY